MPGKDDVPSPGVELRPHAQAHLVGLPAQQLRVDRPQEGAHAVETFGLGAGRQPFEITVRTRDVTVHARPDVDDDVSALRHEYGFPLANCKEQSDRAEPHNALRFCCAAAAAQPPRRSRKNSIPAAAEAPTQRGPGSSRSGLGSGRENSATNGCWQFDHGKQGCREQVVLAGLIYHPELTMRLGFRIWESLIDLTGLE